MAEVLEGFLQKWSKAQETVETRRRDESQRAVDDLGRRLEGAVAGLSAAMEQRHRSLETLLTRHGDSLREAIADSGGVREAGESPFVVEGGTAAEAMVAKLDALVAGLESTRQDWAQAGQMQRTNQAELQAGIEMLNKGLAGILKGLEGRPEAEAAFVQRLESTLHAFHEGASEMLIENAVKTREILADLTEVRSRSAEN